MRINKRIISGLSIFGLVIAICSIPYIFSVIGETQVVFWAWINLTAGILLIILGFMNFQSTKKIAIFITAFVVIGQGVPISYWIIFYIKTKQGIIIQEDIIYHWSYSIPHIIIYILGFREFLSLSNKKIKVRE